MNEYFFGLTCVNRCLKHVWVSLSLSLLSGSTIDVECAQIESLLFMLGSPSYTHVSFVKVNPSERSDPKQTAHDESCWLRTSTTDHTNWIQSPVTAEHPECMRWEILLLLKSMWKHMKGVNWFYHEELIGWWIVGVSEVNVSSYYINVNSITLRLYKTLEMLKWCQLNIIRISCWLQHYTEKQEKFGVGKVY